MHPLMEPILTIMQTFPGFQLQHLEDKKFCHREERANGHGVGLYLCRENLAVAHHKIWYSEPDEGDNYLIKDGANFVIQFNGVEF